MITAWARTIVSTVAVLLLLSVPVAAQEDESGADDQGWGQILVDVGTWAGEPGGFGDQVAGIGDPFGSGGSRVVGFPTSSNPQIAFRIGVEFARNVGRITYSRLDLLESSTTGRRDPGNFVFAELLAYPLYAGFSNDGLADAFDADQRGELRDHHLEYSRIAFSNSRLSSRWFVGYRQVSFDRTVGATYYALSPDLPALVPPLTNPSQNLAPIPDSVSMSSSFEGKGPSAGMEFEFPLGSNKFLVEAKFGLSLMVGDVQTNYAAENSFYTLDGAVIEPPYDEINTMPDNVVQDTIRISTGTDDGSLTSQVFDWALGLRWRAVSFFEVFLGYRSTHYGNITSEIRPVNIVISGSNTINAVDATRTDRSVTYEGVYGGVGFRF